VKALSSNPSTEKKKKWKCRNFHTDELLWQDFLFSKRGDEFQDQFTDKVNELFQQRY
jgi:hypothetical protein